MKKSAKAHKQQKADPEEVKELQKQIEDLKTELASVQAGTGACLNFSVVANEAWFAVTAARWYAKKLLSWNSNFEHEFKTLIDFCGSTFFDSEIAVQKWSLSKLGYILRNRAH